MDANGGNSTVTLTAAKHLGVWLKWLFHIPSSSNSAFLMYLVLSLPYQFTRDFTTITTTSTNVVVTRKMDIDCFIIRHVYG
jgi:hypothetical protein